MPHTSDPSRGRTLDTTPVRQSALCMKRLVDNLMRVLLSLVVGVKATVTSTFLMPEGIRITRTNNKIVVPSLGHGHLSVVTPPPAPPVLCPCFPNTSV